MGSYDSGGGDEDLRLGCQTLPLDSVKGGSPKARTCVSVNILSHLMSSSERPDDALRIFFDFVENIQLAT